MNDADYVDGFSDGAITYATLMKNKLSKARKEMDESTRKLAQRCLDFIAQCKDQNTILPAEVDDLEECARAIIAKKDNEHA